MTYTTGTPLATERPSVSQPLMLANFAEINTRFNVNHYPFTDATVALRGKHKYSVYPVQAGGPATTATECALYSKVSGGLPNLFYRSSSSGAEILMTCNITPLSANRGYSFLPGGFLLQWGRDHANAGNTDIFFPIPFSAAPFVITPTLFRASGGSPQALYVASDVPPDTLHFLIYKSGGGQDFMWTAIGPA